MERDLLCALFLLATFGGVAAGTEKVPGKDTFQSLEQLLGEADFFSPDEIWLDDELSFSDSPLMAYLDNDEVEGIDWSGPVNGGHHLSMGRLLLCLLVLLSVVGTGTAPEQTKSEWCRLWKEGAKWPGYFFLCPKMNGNPADGLCCGTCTDSYCCSSEEDRLNQTLCPERDLTVRGKNRTHKMYVHIILIAVTAGSTFICFAWVTYVLCDVMKRRNSRRHSCDVELHQVILPSDSEVTDDTAIPSAVAEEPQEICDSPPASCEQPALDFSNPDCSTGEDRELPLSPANPCAVPQDALDESMEAESSV